ncbi:MAG: single-stranded DNA-binding protein [Patescibacteria group bacterium]|nr:single-stranded DNA-binding protein [Patescibacteria group bacterium]
MNLNKVSLIGRLTRDPELKTIPSGQALTTFGLATGRFFVDKSGQKQQETEFHNIVLFGRIAEIASQYLTKGSLVYLEGRIRTRSWQDQSGNKRYRTEILAQRLQLGPKTAPKIIPPEKEKGEEKEEEKEKGEQDIPVIEEDEGEIDVKDIPF